MIRGQTKTRKNKPKYGEMAPRVGGFGGVAACRKAPPGPLFGRPQVSGRPAICIIPLRDTGG